MAEMIVSFTGPWEPLSSFHMEPFPVRLGLAELWANSREHAYQASKAIVPHAVQQPAMMKILNAPTAYRAKQLGRQVQLDRTVWDSMSKRVMLELMLAQYAYLGPTAGEVLQATFGAVLVEGNTWGDKNWGAIPATRKLVDAGYPLWRPVAHDQSTWLAGHNWLGQLLMAARLVLS